MAIARNQAEGGSAAAQGAWFTSGTGTCTLISTSAPVVDLEEASRTYRKLKGPSMRMSRWRSCFPSLRVALAVKGVAFLRVHDGACRPRMLAG